MYPTPHVVAAPPPTAAAAAVAVLWPRQAEPPVAVLWPRHAGPQVASAAQAVAAKQGALGGRPPLPTWCRHRAEKVYRPWPCSISVRQKA